MIFDESSPKASQFQKPIFGRKTLLRNPDGTRTGLSYAVSGGIGWMSGLSPLGARFGQKLDSLIQGGDGPDYLNSQGWYAKNVRDSQGKAAAISEITGGVASEVRGIVEKLATMATGGTAAASVAANGAQGSFMGGQKTEPPSTGSLSVMPMKKTEDPNLSFRDIIEKRRNYAMTPEQRRKNEIESARQMMALPQTDTSIQYDDSFGFYSDTPSLVPNFLKGIR